MLRVKTPTMAVETREILDVRTIIEQQIHRNETYKIQEVLICGKVFTNQGNGIRGPEYDLELRGGCVVIYSQNTITPTISAQEFQELLELYFYLKKGAKIGNFCFCINLMEEVFLDPKFFVEEYLYFDVYSFENFNLSGMNRIHHLTVRSGEKDNYAIPDVMDENKVCKIMRRMEECHIDEIGFFGYHIPSTMFAFLVDLYERKNYMRISIISWYYDVPEFLSEKMRGAIEAKERFHLFIQNSDYHQRLFNARKVSSDKIQQLPGGRLCHGDGYNYRMETPDGVKAKGCFCINLFD